MEITARCQLKFLISKKCFWFSAAKLKYNHRRSKCWNAAKVLNQQVCCHLKMSHLPGNKWGSEARVLLQIRHNSSHLNIGFFKLDLIATILALLHDVLFFGMCGRTVEKDFWIMVEEMWPWLLLCPFIAAYRGRFMLKQCSQVAGRRKCLWLCIKE